MWLQTKQNKTKGNKTTKKSKLSLYNWKKCRNIEMAVLKALEKLMFQGVMQPLQGLFFRFFIYSFFKNPVHAVTFRISTGYFFIRSVEMLILIMRNSWLRRAKYLTPKLWIFELLCQELLEIFRIRSVSKPCSLIHFSWLVNSRFTSLWIYPTN